MRHLNKHNKLNKNRNHYKSILNNMTKSLIIHEKIKTTIKKAKILKPFIEKIITISKKNCIHNRRILFSIIRDNKIIFKLFNEMGPKFANLHGGYTKIIKCGFRNGDNALMAYIIFTKNVISNNKHKTN